MANKHIVNSTLTNITPRILHHDL